MAAGLGYKEFTTGDVLTAADANGYLASQVVMVFASAAARTSAIASPQEGMISYLKDTDALQTYSGAAWVSVGGGGGKVLQVVNATTATTITTTSATFVDGGLTATITPTSATSKILVFFTQPIYVLRSAEQCAAGFQILRNATAVNVADAEAFNVYVGSGANSAQIRMHATVQYMDSPASTSALTYKVQWKVGSSTLILQPGVPDTASITLMEIGA